MTDQILADVDLDDPPTDLLVGCQDTFLPALVHQKFEQHRRNASGEWATRPRWRYCGGSPLAHGGLATAMGLKVPESPRWRAFAQVMRSEREPDQCELEARR